MIQSLGSRRESSLSELGWHIRYMYKQSQYVPEEP